MGFLGYWVSCVMDKRFKVLLGHAGLSGGGLGKSPATEEYYAAEDICWFANWPLSQSVLNWWLWNCPLSQSLCNQLLWN